MWHRLAPLEAFAFVHWNQRETSGFEVRPCWNESHPSQCEAKSRRGSPPQNRPPRPPEVVVEVDVDWGHIPFHLRWLTSSCWSWEFDYCRVEKLCYRLHSLQSWRFAFGGCWVGFEIHKICPGSLDSLSFRPPSRKKYQFNWIGFRTSWYDIEFKFKIPMASVSHWTQTSSWWLENGVIFRMYKLILKRKMLMAILLIRCSEVTVLWHHCL